MSNIHEGHRDRMRSRFLQEGADGFADHEILEMLLYGTIPRGDTNEIAHHLLDEFGSISNLIEADPHEITKTAGVGLKSGVFLSLLHELVRRYEKEKLEMKPALTSILRTVDYCKALVAFRPTECFYVIFLDGRRQILHTSKISEGTVNDTAVSPRIVVEKALRYKATGVVLCHNHPNGTVKPSFDDIQLTLSLKKLMQPLGIDVVDHIVIGANEYFSFFENDMLNVE
ncbi:MAG: DNA repair protein RadC [Anaerotignum sp.]|nr:DNA repair protein RadC [Anaerotignum sp.]MBR5590664.1 DNA repair protein RadC [Anaerotignum sp.]